MEWTCDVCGQTVTAKNGWVEWWHHHEDPTDGSPSGGGLRLVHHGQQGCQYNERALTNQKKMLADLPLTSFLGHNGMVKLLLMIHDNDAPIDEVLSMIQRIHIPNYEAARSLMTRAVQEGDYEPNMPPGFHYQEDMIGILKNKDKYLS